MSAYDSFDRAFRRRARAMRRTPEAGGWERIEQRLDAGRRRRRPTIGTKPWLLAALFLILAGTGVLLSLPSDPDPLAQKPRLVEELDDGTPRGHGHLVDYVSVEEGSGEGYLVVRGEVKRKLMPASGRNL